MDEFCAERFGHLGGDDHRGSASALVCDVDLDVAVSGVGR
jgi:hypothetical protein